VLCNRRGRPERALLAAVFALSAGMLDQGSTGTARADIYAFIFSQKGLMAGLGLQGNKITRARASGGITRYNWKILLSGYAPAYAYELGRLDTSLPFADLKWLSHINARAQAAGDAPDFSQRIRAGLPMHPPDSR
jgi:hypothetical protein